MSHESHRRKHTSWFAEACLQAASSGRSNRAVGRWTGRHGCLLTCEHEVNHDKLAEARDLLIDRGLCSKESHWRNMSFSGGRWFMTLVIKS